MIEVRIRHESDATPAHLCYWDPTDLEGVERMLSAWGVRTGEGDRYFTAGSFQSGIVVEDGAAFFEVVLVDSADTAKQS